MTLIYKSFDRISENKKVWCDIIKSILLFQISTRTFFIRRFEMKIKHILMNIYIYIYLKSYQNIYVHLVPKWKWLFHSESSLSIMNFQFETFSERRCFYVHTWNPVLKGLISYWQTIYIALLSQWPQIPILSLVINLKINKDESKRA